VEGQDQAGAVGAEVPALGVALGVVVPVDPDVLTEVESRAHGMAEPHPVDVLRRPLQRLVVVAAVSLVAPILDEEGPLVLRRVVLDVDEHGVDGLQLGMDAVLLVEPQHADDEDLLVVDPSVRGGVAVIDVVVVEIVPPGVRVVPVVHRLLRVELDVDAAAVAGRRREREIRTVDVEIVIVVVVPGVGVSAPGDRAGVGHREPVPVAEALEARVVVQRLIGAVRGVFPGARILVAARAEGAGIRLRPRKPLGVQLEAILVDRVGARVGGLGPDRVHRLRRLLAAGDREQSPEAEGGHPARTKRPSPRASADTRVSSDPGFRVLHGTPPAPDGAKPLSGERKTATGSDREELGAVLAKKRRAKEHIDASMCPSALIRLASGVTATRSVRSCRRSSR